MSCWARDRIQNSKFNSHISANTQNWYEYAECGIAFVRFSLDCHPLLNQWARKFRNSDMLQWDINCFSISIFFSTPQILILIFFFFNIFVINSSSASSIKRHKNCITKEIENEFVFFFHVINKVKRNYQSEVDEKWEKNELKWNT